MEDSTITTESMTAENRDYWREIGCRTLLEGDSSSVSDRAFQGWVAKTSTPDVSFSQVLSVAQRFARSPEHVCRARGEFFIVLLQLRGTDVVSWNGRDVVLNTGDFTRTDSTPPWALTFNGDFEQLVIHLPRDFLLMASGPPERMVARLCQSESSLGRLSLPSFAVRPSRRLRVAVELDLGPTRRESRDLCCLPISIA